MLFWSLFLSCTSSTSSGDTDILGDIILATVSVDYAVGALAVVNSADATLTENIASISGDPLVQTEGDILWQINRYQYDTIRKYDINDIHIPLQEISVAPETGSSNPHGIASCQGKTFVTLYERSEILVLDPASLETITTIDITEYADSDGIAEASSIYNIGNKIFIGLQRLDRNLGFTPLYSMVLSLDCDTLSIVDTWEIGSNIRLFSWKSSDNDTESIGLISAQWEESPSSVYRFTNNTWNYVWSVDMLDNTMSSFSIDQASAWDDRLLLNIATDEGYLVSCVDLANTTVQDLGTFTEYITDIEFQTPDTAWFSAHWGWIDMANSNVGMYEIQTDNCSLGQYIATEIAPVSFAFR